MTDSSNKSRLMVVDDDPGVVEYLTEALAEENRFLVEGFTSPVEALQKASNQDYDLIITDVAMPEMRGTEFLKSVLKAKPDQLVILITAFGSIDLAVQSMRLGACDFVAKPFQIEELLLSIERVFRERKMRREIVRLRSRVPGAASDEVVASSEAMKKVLELARRTADSDSAVLLTGESGTGKGTLARFIHNNSPRRDGPFIHVNCAALPESLVESELFGANKGAFTDAREDRKGLFVEATGGTLFLDEVTEMPLNVQAKLLQALESSKVRPLGSTTEIDVDVRIIAASNLPLEDVLNEGRFRSDLYYRLNVLRIDVPPLRERTEDIMELIDAFLHRTSQRLNRSLIGISNDAMKRLLSYRWPGNVRELANVIERAATLTDHDTILPDDLMMPSEDNDVEDLLGRAASRNLPLAELDRLYIKRIVEACDGNKAQAARVLGIDRRTLYRRIEESDPENAE